MNRASWDIEWAAERAAAATKYLAAHYPECAGAPEVHPHQEAAHEAAVAGDREGYEDALRQYMRAGRGVALAIRKGVA